MENGPSPHADFQPLRLALSSLIVRMGAGSDICFFKRPGLACNSSPGVRTSIYRPYPLSRRASSLAILQAADAMKAETIGPTSAPSVKGSMKYRALIESLGG